MVVLGSILHLVKHLQQNAASGAYDDLWNFRTLKTFGALVLTWIVQSLLILNMGP